MKIDWRLTGIVVVGVLLRFGLHLTNIPKWLSESFEATTPQNGWKNYLEARFLIESGVSPFDIKQSSYHETPIAFLFWRTLAAFADAKLLFILLDVVVCILLHEVGAEAGKFLLARQKEAVLRKRISPRIIESQPQLLLRADSLKRLRHILALSYAANPYAIMACAAYNTNVLNTIVILYTLLAVLRSRLALAAACAALGTYLSIYPLALIVPILLCQPASHTSESSGDSQSEPQTKQTDAVRKAKGKESIDELLFGATSRLRVGLAFVAALSLLVTMSGVVQTSVRPLHARSVSVDLSHESSPFGALKHAYSFVLTVPDLRPNIGLFWYFFTEVFEHFLSFFLAVFQIQIMVYALPLSLKFRDDVLLVFYTLIGLICIFRSYPSYSDVALLLSLTPIWMHLRSQMRSLFISVCIYLACTVLFPILAYLWIYQGSANSNFYYGVSLAFNIAQIFLVTDVVYAYAFRLFALRNSYKLPRSTESDKKPRAFPTLLQYEDSNLNTKTAS